MAEKIETDGHSRSSADVDGATFTSITAPTSRVESQLHKTTSQSSSNIHRTMSLTDGYSIAGMEDEDKEEEQQTQPSDAPDGEAATELLVKWDDNDPENPRNMNYFRKWIITLVVSIGSVCV